MQPVQPHPAADSRLRFVFDDVVVSCRLAANATLEDIAWTLAGLSNQRHRMPLAIDVTLSPAAGPCSRPRGGGVSS
jgi:hypothetical protein